MYQIPLESILVIVISHLFIGILTLFLIVLSELDPLKYWHLEHQNIKAFL